MRMQVQRAVSEPPVRAVVQLDQLMGHFSHQTGSQFTGSGGQYQMLAKLASDKLGIPVPPQLLEKL